MEQIKIGKYTLELYRQDLTENQSYRNQLYHIVKLLMLHETGVINDLIARFVQPDDGIIGEYRYSNIGWWTKTATTLLHAIIGKDKNGLVKTYQLAPFEMAGAHAGGRANAIGCLGTEIARGADNDADYFYEAYRQAVLLYAYWCREFKIPIHMVIDHAEGCKYGVASNHSDVKKYFAKFGKSIHTFRADIEKVLGRWEVPKTYIINNPHGSSLAFYDRPKWQDGAKYDGSVKALKRKGTPNELKVISRIDPVWVHARVDGKEGYFDLMYCDPYTFTKYGTPLIFRPIKTIFKKLAFMRKNRIKPYTDGGENDLPPTVHDVTLQDALERSLQGIECSCEGWGYLSEYGAYRINQDHITDPNKAGYGWLTLRIELAGREIATPDQMYNGELSCVEEHIKNGEIIYPVGEPRTIDNNTFIPFYFDKVKNPDRGKHHENGIYWLYTKYIDKL